MVTLFTIITLFSIKQNQHILQSSSIFPPLHIIVKFHIHVFFPINFESIKFFLSYKIQIYKLLSLKIKILEFELLSLIVFTNFIFLSSAYCFRALPCKLSLQPQTGSGSRKAI
jgi:hypothetical protein